MIESWGLSVDNNGVLYFCDPGCQRIKKIDTDGIVTTIAGTGIGGYNGDNIAATTAELYTPAGLCMDSHGDLIVADDYNNRVRKIGLSTAGVANVANKQGIVSVYPNPGNGNITVLITAAAYEEVALSITDISGCVVATADVWTNKPQLLPTLTTPGIYMLTAKGNSLEARKEFVVK